MTRAGVGSDDTGDFQDRPKGVAIEGWVRAQGKLSRFHQRMREYDCPMPRHREGLLDLERNACRRDDLP